MIQNLPPIEVTHPDKSTSEISGKTFQKGCFVLWFYPRDMTSGCTREAQDFRDVISQFTQNGFEVYGISNDSITSHQKFITKENLNFPLISDAQNTWISKFGAWKEKSMYGKKFWGTERSTFVIINGEIVQEWRKVRVPGHVELVLETISKIAKP